MLKMLILYGIHKKFRIKMVRFLDLNYFKIFQKLNLNI